MVLGPWLAWVAIDLARLGVFGGARALSSALAEMPSVQFPLFALLVFTPLAVRAWLRGRRQREFPREPWMWDRRWDRRGARSLAAARALQPLAFALPVTAVSGAIALVATGTGGSDLILIALTPFFAAALGFWIWFAARLGPLVRYGRPYFRYDRFPFRLGERVEGVLEGVEKIDGFERMTLTLRCVSEHRSGSSRNRSVRREILREEVREIGAAGLVRRLARAADGGQAAGATRVVVPVRFELPDQDLGTKLHANPARRWELHARAERPGFDFEAVFLLPVYPPQKG
jgi:hypothetical protein